MPPGCINSCFAPNEAETYLARIPSRDGLRINKPAAGQPLLLKERNDDPTTIDDSVDRSSTESSRRISRNNLISSTFLKFTKEQKPALNERSSYDEALGDQPYEAKYSALEPLEVAHCPDDCEHVQPLPALPHPRLERGSSSLVDDEPETSSRDVRPKFVRTSDGEYELSHPDKAQANTRSFDRRRQEAYGVKGDEAARFPSSTAAEGKVFAEAQQLERSSAQWIQLASFAVFTPAVVLLAYYVRVLSG